MLMLEK